MANASKAVALARVAAIASSSSVIAGRHATGIAAMHAGLPEAIAPARAVAIAVSGRASTIVRLVARPIGARMGLGDRGTRRVTAALVTTDLGGLTASARRSAAAVIAAPAAASQRQVAVAAIRAIRTTISLLVRRLLRRLIRTTQCAARAIISWRIRLRLDRIEERGVRSEERGVKSRTGSSYKGSRLFWLTAKS